MDNINADAVHIATEGPIGMAARRWCLRRKASEISTIITHTHTFQICNIRSRPPIPRSWSYAWLRRFHGRAEKTLVPNKVDAIKPTKAWL
ncbi:MAG: hypothetical protein Q9N32_05240 [Gammaproteobacteria bacterium]|nr:hypothetical protein [Gammaproteobacteria bacterium]